jgi:hypothetical protein
MKITFEKTVVGRWKAASLGHRSGIYVYEQNEQNKKFTEKKNQKQILDVINDAALSYYYYYIFMKPL